MERIHLLLKAEQRQVEDFIRLYRSPRVDQGLMVYDRWSTHDILVHILVWHESFAANVQDLAQGLQPTPETGRYHEITDRGLAKYRDASIRTLLRRLRKAQRTIEDNVLAEGITLIPYRQGGPFYSPADHLELVRGHVRRHCRDVFAVQFGSSERRPSAHLPDN